MKKSLILISALGVVGVANAQIFTNAAAFQAAIGNDPGQYLNTFTGPQGTAPWNYSGGAPTMTYTVNADPVSGGSYSSGTFVGTNLPSQSLVITFTSGNVRAVGGNFFHTNISDVFQAVPVTLTYSDGTVDTYNPASASQFRGYVSNTILTSVVMSTGVTTYASMDNLVTSTVPEPATISALALGAAAMLRRRKKA